jgi:hypothetical protein
VPAASSTPRGKPPVLTQGTYRSSFKRARPAFGNVTNEESWPPKRRKKMTKDNDVSADVEMTDACGSRVETNKAVSALPADASVNGLTRLRPPAQVNAVASSSKVLLPGLPHPAKPTNLLQVICAKGAPSSDIHTDAPCSPKPIQDTNSNFVKKENHDGSVTDSSSRNSVPIKSIHHNRLISSPNDDVNLQLARLSVEVDDPFIASKHTTTSPIGNLILHPRRIDLRQSLNATRRRSRSSTASSPSHRSNLSFVIPEDREVFNQVGFRKVMAVVAKNYGFDVDVAMKAFFATKSIEKTKSLLQFAKEVTNSATSALLSELVSDDDIDSSDDEEAPHQSMRRGHNNKNSSPPNQRSALNSGRQKTKRSFGGPRKSTRLSIKPRPLDEEIVEMAAFSDYSPPRVTRAGQFMRLVKEGRREEAVDRERRRASGVFVTQTQAQAQRYDDDEDQQRQQSSPDNMNISLPVDDDDEEHHQHDQRIFIKRISEGQSSLNEDEDDPEVLKLAQEHRNLVMNVMEENADALRSFEQRNNQDLLRIWSLDWARQKIADM